MASERADWPSFRIRLDFSDAELDAYRCVTAAARNRFFGRHRGWIMLAIGVGLGFVVVWAATASGALPRDDAGLLGLVVAAIFGLGLYSPWLLAGSANRRSKAAFRARWDGATLLVAPGSITIRLGHVRAVYGQAAIRAVTFHSGLVLLWIGAYSAIPVPARLLTPEQQKQLLSIKAAPARAAPA